MAEAGGSTTQSGILYQNSIAALYLGRLCDSRPRPDSETVIKVRVEAPVDVDDVVVTYADGHLEYIQAKEHIAKGDEAWQKLWKQFEKEWSSSSFQKRKDRLVFYTAETRKEYRLLKETCPRAGGHEAPDEWWSSLSDEHRTLAEAILLVLSPKFQDQAQLHSFMQHIDVTLRDLTEIERDKSEDWMPASNISKRSLFVHLRDRTGKHARYKAPFTAEILRAALADLYDIRIDDPLQIILPFRSFDNANLFGLEDDPSAFIPTKAEHQEGRVHAPRVRVEVEAALEGRGWALVQGLGASGKTVLATQIALRYGLGFSYYLDLAEGDDLLYMSDALASVTSCAMPGVLFVIDNVHRQEKFAADLFRQWQSSPKGSHLLMLGRFVQGKQNWSGRRSPLASLKPVITLKIGDDDLLGVYRRLASRGKKAVESLPLPSDSTLSKWHHIFGGDLIAFGTAVEYRMNKLIAGEWGLSPQDSIEYVRDKYLYHDEATHEEERCLLLLSVFSELELTITESLVSHHALAHAIQLGLVHVSSHRYMQEAHYQLVHAGMGELLLAASRMPASERPTLDEASRKELPLGIFACARLDSSQDRDRSPEAVALLHVLVSMEEALFRSASRYSLRVVTVLTDMLMKHEILTTPQINDRLITVQEDIIEKALHTGLVKVKAFLQDTETKHLEVCHIIADALCDPRNMRTFGKTVLNSPLSHTKDFLWLSNHRFPHLYNDIKNILEDRQNLIIIKDKAVRTQLHLVRDFLWYAQEHLPNAFAAVSNALAEIVLEGHGQEYEAFTGTVFGTPLDCVTAFLKYCEGDLASGERRLPDAYQAVAQILQDDYNHGRLQAAALSTSLDGLVNFIVYSKEKLPRCYTSLENLLSTSEAINSLAVSLCYAPLGAVVSFLRIAPMATSLVTQIDAERWNRAREAESRGEPNYIHSLVQILQRLGRPELVAAPASAFVREADMRQWQGQNLFLPLLIQTLRFGANAGHEAVERFVKRITATDWLASQYRNMNTKAGTIGALLWHVWASYGKLVNNFTTNDFKWRVQVELENLGQAKEDQLWEALKLLGSMPLVEMEIETNLR